MDASKLIIAIVGQTATGKSATATELAERFGGEIICADSRTIYKGMDIGTAKPSGMDRERVPHYGLDLITPGQSFSAYDFQQYAKTKIVGIQARGNTPFIVGGTGLYVDGLLYDYSFGPEANPKLRAALDQKTLPELQKMAHGIGLREIDVSFQNRRHLSRAVERGKITLQKKQLFANAFLYGISVSSESLSGLISDRIDCMLKYGLVDEVRGIMGEYGAHAPGLLAPVYKPMVEYILGKCTLDEATEQAKINDRQLAKRQMTWFKRNPDIVWVQSVGELKKEITPRLTKI